ncbi:heat shock protein Hsp20 [Zopfochytrium polystomum]|nr:heat shock protein Hsp20 [Zopfochytrium polystomum]
MSLIFRDPFTSTVLDDFFSPSFPRFASSAPGVRTLFTPGGVAATADLPVVPRMDITEADDKYVVTAELPGLKKEDVSVSVRGDVVTISGEKKEEREEEGAHRHVVERSWGRFSRSVRLPVDAGTDQLQATMKEGVLSLEVPKSTELREGRRVVVA